MSENIKVAREHRKLETNMNVPPVDEKLYIRTWRSRNIPYVKVPDDDVPLLLACRQLRFSLYSTAVTTKALTIVVFLYYSLSLALWSIYALCLLPRLL